MADESPLSEREADIMRQVVTGASNREIAITLAISPNTVKVHLRNIYEKLGVASRTEATLVVLREGWVEVEGMVLVDEAEREPVAALALRDPVIPDELVLASPWQEPQPDNAVVTEIIIPARPTRTSSLLVIALGATVLVLLLALLSLRLYPASPPVAAPVAELPSRWQQLAQLPAARTGAMAATLSRTLLVAGGAGANGPAGELWRYELSTGRWEASAPLPVPVRGASTAVLSGDLFVVGGVDEEGSPTALLQRYDPERDEWSELSLPSPLARGALAAFEGELFLFGGWDGSEIQDGIYRYQPEDEAWEPVATLPTPRADLAAVAVGDGIVLVGGIDGTGQALDEVLHFDPRNSDSLRAEAPLPVAEATPRLVALGDALYLLGTEGLFERDPEHQWHRLPLPDSALPQNAALVASDPYIVVVGGEQAGSPVPTVWQYQALYRSFVPIVPSGP